MENAAAFHDVIFHFSFIIIVIFSIIVTMIICIIVIGSAARSVLLNKYPMVVGASEYVEITMSMEGALFKNKANAI